jgi:tetratricopeptide (TPR) repeat protein
MKKIFLITIGLALSISCSSTETIQDELKTQANSDTSRSAIEASNHFVDGTILEMKGMYAEAILEYQEALELDPDGGIHYAIANNYYRLNKMPQAIKHAQKAVEFDKNHIEYKELLGKIYINSQLPDSAITVFESIVELDSLNTNALFNLAYLYERNKPSKALDTYNKLLDKTGPEWNLLVKIADLNERMGNVEKTIETVEELVQLNPSNLEMQKLLIESYIKTAKYDKAMQLIDESLTVFPDDMQLIEMRAGIFIQKGELEKGSLEYVKLINREDFPFEGKVRIAGAFFNQALRDSSSIELAKNIMHEINSDSLDWQVNAYLGELEMRENNDSLAIEYFTTSTDLAAWNADIWIRLGGLLFDNARYQIAVDKISTVIENFPDEFVLNIILALSYGQLNNYDEALPYVQKAVELNPGDFTSLYAYGFTLNQLDRKDDAITYLKKALEVNPDNVQILGTLGLIYDAKEMWDECDDAYQTALSIDSTDVLVLNNYAYSLAERDIDLERALEMSNKAVEGDSANSSYLDTKGWILFKLGKYEEAKKYIKKAIELDKENAVLLEHLGDVQYKLGYKKEALALWEESYELDSSILGLKEKIDKGEL